MRRNPPAHGRTLPWRPARGRAGRPAGRHRPRAASRRAEPSSGGTLGLSSIVRAGTWIDADRDFAVDDSHRTHGGAKPVDAGHATGPDIEAHAMRPAGHHSAFELSCAERG